MLAPVNLTESKEPTDVTDLGALFRKYGSDKCLNGYTPLYQTLFRGRQHENVELLEVGIGTMIPGVHSSMVGYAQENYKPGGSLRAWRDYFSNGTITGIDVQKDTQFSEDRITTHLCSSTDRQEVQKLFGGRQFDIIIDDGSHLAQDQMSTLCYLLPHLKKDGIYVIEDIHPGSYVNMYPDMLQKLHPDTLQFLVGKTLNQMVITFADHRPPAVPC